LQVGNGTSGSIASNITNNTSVVFNPGTTNNTYAGVMDGTGGLTKAGANTLILSGNNSYGGATQIDGGILQLSGSPNRLPTTTTVNLANTAGAALDLNGQAQSLVGLTGGGATGGNVTLGAATLTLEQTANHTYAGAISGTGGVIKNQAGTLILDGANSFTGGLEINAGVVQVGNGSTTGALANNVPILNNAGLVVNKSNDLTLNGAITGGGSLAKQGTGVLILGGANTYGGGTTISGGTVRIGAAGAIPDAGTLTIAANGTLSTAGGAGGAGIAETAGTLLTTGSAIELGTGIHILTFNGLDQTSAGNLQILGWVGEDFKSGTQGRIVFNNLGADPNTTYQTWLSSVNFVGQTPSGGFFLDIGSSQFELVPVPEPGTVLGIAAAGLAGLGLLRRRLRRKTEPAVAA
jgi:autotransporter-associated beta strand protein